MERRIKHNNVGYSGEDFHKSANTLKVGWVMQGCEMNYLFYRLNDFRRN